MAGHEGAYRSLIEVPQLELRNVLKQLGTQIKAHGLGDPIGQVGHTVLQQGLEQQHAAYRQENVQQQISVARRHGIIHRNANERRPNPHQAREQHHQHTGSDKPTPVRLDLGQNFAECCSVKNAPSDFVWLPLAHQSGLHEGFGLNGLKPRVDHPIEVQPFARR